MAQKNDGGPAFPILDHKIGYHADIRQKADGLTLRDYFAAQTFPAAWALAMEYCRDASPEAWAAERAYAMADAMIAARDAD